MDTVQTCKADSMVLGVPRGLVTVGVAQRPAPIGRAFERCRDVAARAPPNIQG